MLLSYQRRRHRINFMSVFPYHVITDVVAMLPFKDRIRCTRVCRAWRSLLISWPGMWCDIQVGPFGPHYSVMARYFKWMDGPYIRKITFRNQNKHDTEQLFLLLIECKYHHPIQVLCM